MEFLDVQWITWNHAMSRKLSPADFFEEWGTIFHHIFTSQVWNAHKCGYCASSDRTFQCAVAFQPSLGKVFEPNLLHNLGLSSAAFYADAIRRVNLLTLAFALHFPAFERLRSTRSLLLFLHSIWYAPFMPLCLKTIYRCWRPFVDHVYGGEANAE